MAKLLRSNTDYTAPQAEAASPADKMAAFDRLPKTLRDELNSNALLEYTPLHFLEHYLLGLHGHPEGMDTMKLLEVLWAANRRDHLTRARLPWGNFEKVCAVTPEQLKKSDFRVERVRRPTRNLRRLP